MHKKIKKLREASCIMDYETNYLEHHGIKGMKWGIRRFQNEDGSYTKAGLARYRYDEEKYNEAKSNEIAAKKAYKTGAGSKSAYAEAKAKTKAAQRQLSKAYDQVKKDKRADEGRRLYESGKRVNSMSFTANYARFAAAAAVNIGASKLHGMGKVREASALRVVGNVFIAATYVRNYVLGKKLSAYYGHSRPSNLKPPKK